MRIILLSGLITFVFCSCNSYRYFTVASENTLQNEGHEFVVENDTVRVSYNFHGKNGPVRISVYNKSDRALQVDWKRSALIVDGTPSVYYRPDLWINGNVETARLSPDHTLQARVTGEEGIEFLPPRSSVSKTGALLTDKSAALRVTGYRQSGKGKKGALSSAKESPGFSKATSPLVFRSYLTLIVPGSGNPDFTVDSQFYISGITNRKGSFDMAWLRDNTRGNEFCVRNPNNGSKGILAMGAAVAAIFVIYEGSR